jgi:hypothetical protein
MPTYSFPSNLPNPVQLNWRLEPVVLQSVSPLSGATQTVEMPGAGWVFDAQWAPRRGTRMDEFEAFLARLRGSSNRFTVWPWHRPVPVGTMRGAPVVAASPPSGDIVLNITTTPGATLLAGDFVGVAGELKQVVVGGTANGSGALTVEVSPPFRAAPAPGAAITWNRPTATFIAQAAPGIAVASLGFVSIAFGGQEVFP